MVFRGIAPTCVGHSKMVSAGYYLSQEQVEKAKTTGGTLRRSPNRAATAMQVPEELDGVWQGPPKDKVVPEVSSVLFPEMVRPETPRPSPSTTKLVEVATPVSFAREEPINPCVKIAVSDDTEIPEAWKDYL